MIIFLQPRGCFSPFSVVINGFDHLIFVKVHFTFKYPIIIVRMIKKGFLPKHDGTRLHDYNAYQETKLGADKNHSVS
ncbi:MAG: hypothetical protein ACJA1O_003262 [Spirosomataceae bacterium]|jgi:hypothetical protein